MDMTKKIKAQYLGASNEYMGCGNIYYLLISEEKPNTVVLQDFDFSIAYSSVYDFFNEWKLN